MAVAPAELRWKLTRYSAPPRGRHGNAVAEINGHIGGTGISHGKADFLKLRAHRKGYSKIIVGLVAVTVCCTGVVSVVSRRQAISSEDCLRLQEYRGRQEKMPSQALAKATALLLF